ncbi:MAG: hypothetical protein R8G34_07155 [Paracoccaceae bacterium]|nr:hypothetical protein [Paracoccaceae bacterium]
MDDVSKRPRLGIALTIIYLTVVGLIVVVNWQSFARLEPNAWGDFLAGSLGLLALFWLILGYFQQGDELRNSVRALEQQSKELSASVQQQRDLVKSNENAAKLEIQRFLGSLEIEAAKLQDNMRFDARLLPSLLSDYDSNGRAHLTFSHGVKSGAVEQHDNEVAELTKEITKILENTETLQDIPIPNEQDQLIRILRVLHTKQTEAAEMRKSLEAKLSEISEKQRLRAMNRQTTS